MPRRDTEYSKAVAHAERETRFFVATQIKATVPAYRIEVEKRISELQLAHMSDEEKSALKAETISKAKNFVRHRVVSGTTFQGHGGSVQVGAERNRQLDSLYRLMTHEQRAQFDEGRL